MIRDSKRSVFAILLSISLCLIAGPAFSSVGGSTDTALLKGLKWREIGPFRGGRVTTVTGVPGKPMLYYMGATGGGQHLGPGARCPPSFDAGLRETPILATATRL